MVAGALAALSIAAGCGGGDSDSGGGEISKAAFIKKADAICAKNNERMAKASVALIKRKNFANPTRAEYEAVVDKALVPGVKREVEELKALGAPNGDEDVVNSMITALEEGVETAERDPKAVSTSSDAIFGIASRLAGEYGLKVCGSR